MQCGHQGVALIQEFEGFRDTSYQDQGGRWTIGFGCAQPFVTEGMTCTEDQATAWLCQDVSLVAAAITRLVKVPINQNQFDSFCSLTYNIGQGNFAHSSALTLFNGGYADQVPAHIALWCRVDGIVNVGLVRRRTAEIALYNSPVVPE